VVSARASDSVLITGAGTGFGLETALCLASSGYRVYATVPDLSQSAAISDSAAKRRLELRILRLDVTDARSIRDAVDVVVAETGGIYGLVNNAGLGLRGFFEDLSEAEILRLFEVNLFGAMRVTRAVLPAMRASGRGRIVMISSAGGRIAAMTLSGYCSGKFALEGFAEALALEVGALGLHVSLIEPGLSLTPHFTVNRGRAAAALDPGSPYHDWFLRHEALVDEELEKGRIEPAHVARAVARALSARNPRLRYVVGRWPKLLIFLQRHLPGESFHRLYARFITRKVAGRFPPVGDREVDIQGRDERPPAAKEGSVGAG
jgi:NAD(P)-dependent dehydrogenase (short-subunit alcohol dehydrogenase family)